MPNKEFHSLNQIKANTIGFPYYVYNSLLFVDSNHFYFIFTKK